MNNAQIAELLSEDDETAMQYLENLTVEEYEDVRPGYKITFVSQFIVIALSVRTTSYCYLFLYCVAILLLLSLHINRDSFCWTQVTLLR